MESGARICVGPDKSSRTRRNIYLAKHLLAAVEATHPDKQWRIDKEACVASTSNGDQVFAVSFNSAKDNPQLHANLDQDMAAVNEIFLSTQFQPQMSQRSISFFSRILTSAPLKALANAPAGAFSFPINNTYNKHSVRCSDVFCFLVSFFDFH